MTTYETPIVVGIFEDEAKARSAVETLRNSGFAYEQVGVAMLNASTTTQNLQGDLVNLGVPQERASYYDKEYNAGRIVVSVRPDGRNADAQQILRNNGGYDYNAANPAQSGEMKQQTSNNQPSRQPDTVQPGTYPPGPEQSANYGQNDFRRNSPDNQS